MESSDFLYEKMDAGFSSSDLLSLFAITISVFSLFFTYYSVFLSKQVEIKILMFNKLCFEPVEAFLKEIDTKLNGTLFRSEEQNFIVDVLTDLNTYLISLSVVYPNIHTSTFDTLTDDFSDCIYGQNSVADKKIEYFKLKQILLSTLLEYAIFQELSVVKKLWFKYIHSPLKNVFIR